MSGVLKTVTEAFAERSRALLGENLVGVYLPRFGGDGVL